MAVSSAVTAGINATATQYNNLRTDAITQKRRFLFEVKGGLVVGNGQVELTIPANMTLTKIVHKVESGSATIRVMADATQLKAGISVGTSYAAETTSFDNTALTQHQELKVDITGSSSGDTLRGYIECTEII
jgi:hypothetical protein